MDAASDTAPVKRTPSFRAGSELREARERLGWDLGEVAAALRIKLAYLQAIEDGRVSALPGNAYALGFLRTYATTLGLDPDEISRRFRAEASDVNARPNLAFPAPVPERGVPTGAMVLLGVLIAVVAYGAWYRLGDRETATTHGVPAIPEQMLDGHKAAVSPQVASVMPQAGTATPSLPNPTLPPAVTPIVPAPATGPASGTSQASATSQAASTGAGASSTTEPAPASSPTTTVTPDNTPPAMAELPAPAGASTTPGAVAVTPVPATGQPASTTPPAAPTTDQKGVVLHASAVTWVQVRAPGGKVVWDHVMQPGDTWSVPADASGLVLTTGNAGGLSITTDGASTGLLGRNGSVRRNLALDPASLKAAIAAGSTTGSTNGATTGAMTGASTGTARPASGTSTPAIAPKAQPTPAVHHTHRAIAPAEPDSTADQLNGRQLDARKPVSPTGHAPF